MTLAQILGPLFMGYALAVVVLDAIDGKEMSLRTVAILLAGAILIAGGDA